MADSRLQSTTSPSSPSIRLSHSIAHSPCHIHIIRIGNEIKYFLICEEKEKKNKTQDNLQKKRMTKELVLKTSFFPKSSILLFKSLYIIYLFSHSIIHPPHPLFRQSVRQSVRHSTIHSIASFIFDWIKINKYPAVVSSLLHFKSCPRRFLLFWIELLLRFSHYAFNRLPPSYCQWVEWWSQVMIINTKFRNLRK